MQHAVARHQRLVDPLIINQVAHRFAHFRVGEMRLLHAHRHVVDRALLHGFHRQLRILTQGVDVGHRHVAGDIQIALLHHQAQRLRLLEMAQHDAVHLGLFTPVVGVALHAQHVFCLPGLEHKRPGTGFVGGQPAVAPIAVHLMAQHRFAVQHAEVAQRAEGVDHQLRIVGLWQGELHGVVIQGFNLLVNILFGKAVGFPHRRLGQVQVQQAAHRPHHILGGERIAGVEGHVVAQMEGQGFAVRRNVPGLRQRRFDVGEGIGIQFHQ